jgi:hypothetical protein
MSGPAGFDIRIPLGWLFVVLGAILAVWGFFTPAELYARSLDTNVNLGWGIAMLFFGGTSLAFARRDPRQ